MYLFFQFGNNIYMNNKEYDKLVRSIIKKENPAKNVSIAFITGGIMGVLGQILYEFFLHVYHHKGHIYI